MNKSKQAKIYSNGGCINHSCRDCYFGKKCFNIMQYTASIETNSVITISKSLGSEYIISSRKKKLKKILNERL